MKQNKLLVTWDDIDSSIQYIIHGIMLADFKPRKVCGISRGGLVPGVMLSHYFDVPFEPIEPTTVLLDDKDVLIVDDIYDSGKTIELLRKYNPSAHFATLFLNAKHDIYAVDYFGYTSVDDEWIIFPWEICHDVKSDTGRSI